MISSFPIISNCTRRLIVAALTQTGGRTRLNHSDLMMFLLPSFILKLTCSRLWRKIFPCVSRLNRKAAETITVHTKNVTSVFKTCPVPAVPIQKIKQHQHSEILLNCTLFQSIKCVKGEDEHVSFFYATCCINVVLVILFTSSILCKLIWVH